MSHWRRVRDTGRKDANQDDIVKALKAIPGVTVQTGVGDILIGYEGRNTWVEIKTSEKATIKPSQIKLRNEWKGQYLIAWNIDMILKEMGIE